MRGLPGIRPWIGYLPHGAEGYFRQLAPDMNLACQQGETLGERLDYLLTLALANGAGKAVVMDSDSPDLPGSYLTQAFAELDRHDVVIGPTRDGGYYLIGMKKPHPVLLREVQMSTPQVLSDTLKLAALHQIRVSLLPEWYDVDTIADLRQLQSVISTNRPERPECSFPAIARHTWQWLAKTNLPTGQP
jgi:hypothetical protein